MHEHNIICSLSTVAAPSHWRRQAASTKTTMDNEKDEEKKKEYRFSPVIYVTFLAKSIRCLHSRQPVRVCLTALVSPLFCVSHIITYNIRFRVCLFVHSSLRFNSLRSSTYWVVNCARVDIQCNSQCNRIESGSFLADFFRNSPVNLIIDKIEMS